MTAHPCLTCHRPTTDDDPRCPSCERAQRTARYSPNWQRQSRQAIARAPWCALCSSNENLTTDHVPGIGIRVLSRLAIRGHDATRSGGRELTDGDTIQVAQICRSVRDEAPAEGKREEPAEPRPDRSSGRSRCARRGALPRAAKAATTRGLQARTPSMTTRLRVLKRH